MGFHAGQFCPWSDKGPVYRQKLCASLSDTKWHVFMLMIIVDRDFPVIRTYANR